MKVEYPKTPWRIAGPRGTVIEDCGGNAIAHFDDTRYSIEDNATRAAAFVVRVNAHDDLVAALIAIIIQVNQGKVLERDACITQARAALAKVRKEV